MDIPVSMKGESIASITKQSMDIRIFYELSRASQNSPWKILTSVNGKTVASITEQSKDILASTNYH